MGSTSVPVLRNDNPLILLSTDVEGKSLADMRAELKGLGVIIDSDVFVDKKGFAVPVEKEAEWKLDNLLARSDDKTLKLKSTERQPKKSLFDKLTEAAPKGDALDAAKLPEAGGEKSQLRISDETVKPIDFKNLVGALAMGNDVLSDPIALDKEAWINIVERNNLLRGIRLDGEAPCAAFKPAFSIPGGIPRFVVDDSSKVSSTLTHSESTRARVENKFTKVEASASYCFVAASFERTHRHSTAEKKSESKTYAIGSWRIPRVIVQLRPEDLKADAKLSDTVRRALAAEGNAERKYFALRAVFREFGQVWATEVTLGGELTVSDEVVVTETMTEEMIEDSVRAAISARVSLFKASAGAAVTDAKDEKGKLLNQFQSKEFLATGGDTRRTQEPGSWVSTVGPATNWRVIERRGVLPLYMVLDEDLRSQVRKILDEVDIQLTPETLRREPPRQISWGQAVRAERDGFLVAQIVGVPPTPLRAGSMTVTTENWLAASGPSTLPGTPPAAASVWSSAAGPVTDSVTRQTLTLPVRHREIMIVEPYLRTPVQRAPAASTNICWYETEYLDEALFDPPQELQFSPIDPKQSGAREEGIPVSGDGFVVLRASCDLGVAGTVEVQANGEVTATLSLDGAKAGVFYASACVPVLTGKKYVLRVSPKIAVAGRFVAISPRTGHLGEPMPLEPSIYYFAESDGFYFGCVYAPGDAHVDADLVVAPSREDVEKSRPVAATELHTLRGATVAAACIAAPIQKGNYYCLRTNCSKGSIRFTGMFFPLRRY